MEYRQLVKSNKLLMYKIKYKNTRNISAKVDKNNEVIVTCPPDIDLVYVDEFIMMNFDKFYNFIQRRENECLINFNENKATLLGKPCELKIQIVDGREKYEIIDNKIYLFLRDENNKKKMMNKLLTDVGHDYLVKRTKFWLKQMNQSANSIDTKWYESKWGQCEYRGKAITLAIQLYMLNEQLIDYVIIHEISHLTHPNHSSDFWELVEKYYPNWKIAKNKLKYEC